MRDLEDSRLDTTPWPWEWNITRFRSTYGNAIAKWPYRGTENLSEYRMGNEVRPLSLSIRKRGHSGKVVIDEYLFITPYYSRFDVDRSRWVSRRHHMLIQQSERSFFSIYLYGTEASNVPFMYLHDLGTTDKDCNSRHDKPIIGTYRRSLYEKALLRHVVYTRSQSLGLIVPNKHPRVFHSLDHRLDEGRS